VKQLNDLFSNFLSVIEQSNYSFNNKSSILNRNISIATPNDDDIMPVEGLPQNRSQDLQDTLNRASDHISLLRAPMEFPTLDGSEEKKVGDQEKASTNPLDRPIIYKDKAGRDGRLTKSSFRELLSMDCSELGRVWSLIPPVKYSIYKDLTAEQQGTVDKNLTRYAFSKAQRDYRSAEKETARNTFSEFGNTLNQIPGIHEMDDISKSETLYSHYLSFLEQNDTAWPAFKTSVDWFMRKDPVTAIKEGHGRCGEHSRVLREMLDRAGIPVDTVEAWEDVQTRDRAFRADRYVKDRDGIRGASSTNHQSVMVSGRDEDGNRQQRVFDPARYFHEKRRKGEFQSWGRSVNWSEWVDYNHRYGFDGPLNVFIQGDRVVQDFNRELFLAPPAQK